MTPSTILALLSVSAQTVCWATQWAVTFHLILLMGTQMISHTERPHPRVSPALVRWGRVLLVSLGATLLGGSLQGIDPSSATASNLVGSMALALAAHSLAYAWHGRRPGMALVGLLLASLGGWLG